MSESAFFIVISGPHTVANAILDTSFGLFIWSFKFVHLSLPIHKIRRERKYEMRIQQKIR